jgi:hypothetical protein
MCRYCVQKKLLSNLTGKNVLAATVGGLIGIALYDYGMSLKYDNDRSIKSIEDRRDQTTGFVLKETGRFLYCITYPFSGVAVAAAKVTGSVIKNVIQGVPNFLAGFNLWRPAAANKCKCTHNNTITGPCQGLIQDLSYAQTVGTSAQSVGSQCTIRPYYDLPPQTHAEPQAPATAPVVHQSSSLTDSNSPVSPDVTKVVKTF